MRNLALVDAVILFAFGPMAVLPLDWGHRLVSHALTKPPKGKFSGGSFRFAAPISSM